MKIGAGSFTTVNSRVDLNETVYKKKFYNSLYSIIKIVKKAGPAVGR